MMMPHILSEMTIPEDVTIWLTSPLTKIVLLLRLLVETILVDRVLPPWVNPHSIIVNPVEGIGILTAVEAEMTIPENVIIWHLYQTLQDQDCPFVGADPGKVIIEKSRGGRFLLNRN